MTLHGGALRGLAWPLTSVGSNLHQRGRTIAPPIGTTPKIIVSSLHFISPIPPLRSYAKSLLSVAQLLDLHV